jgi:NAD(P)-dependent dehydrogenase (short-subunit alcohol dehydrogenase family)
MGRVTGKVAVVTGGARGIGKSSCELLAMEGASVAVTDVIDDEGEAVARSIADEGGEAAYWHLDVSNESEVESTFAKIKDRFGKIDVLVNNAGIAGANKPTHELALEEWEKVCSINEKGVFLCTKHAIPYMKDNGSGSIINLSSIYGIISAPDLPPYHASKGAVRLMTKTDALFYAGDSIRVNSVHPGYIWTPLVEQLGEESDEGLEEFRENLASLHPLGRVGAPEDIAGGILFLASDESSFMTGSELVIDGGYTAQ